MRGSVVSDLDELAELRPAWDELAVACASPRSAPAPVLAWYRHIMKSHTSPRVLVARDGDTLTGVLPLIIYKPKFRPVNCDIAGLGVLNTAEPVCLPGQESGVAVAFGEALAKVEPVPDALRLGYIDRTSPWIDAIRAAWPWRPTTPHVAGSSPRLRVSLVGGYDAWFAKRSSHFRQRLRVSIRQMEADGFEVFHTTDASEIIPRLPQVIEQWNERRALRLDGGTIFDEDVLAALRDVATELAGQGRFWLSGIERGGQLMASGLIVTAGPVATFWVGGFDATWSRLSPGTRMIDIVIAFAAERGYEELDLGVGDQPYKYRMTDLEDHLDMIDFERRELRPLHSPMRLMTYDQRSALKSQLQRRLRRVAPGDAAPSDAAPKDRGTATSGGPTVTG